MTSWMRTLKADIYAFLIADGIPSLLRQKEGWEPLPCPGLSKLNAMTVKNSYPLPLIPDILNSVSKSKVKYFTKLDIQWGYNNVRIKAGDEWKAAFQMNCGLFKPLVMFFGITNSLAMFQTMMNDIFQELIDKGVMC